jgi:hypothetical protein
VRERESAGEGGEAYLTPVRACTCMRVRTCACVYVARTKRSLLLTSPTRPTSRGVLANDRARLRAPCRRPRGTGSRASCRERARVER